MIDCEPRSKARAESTAAPLCLGLDELQLAGVAPATVGGPGLRAVTADDRFVWTIVGPGPPDFLTSSLRRAPLDVVRPGAVIAGEIVADGLPPAARGLVVVHDHALALVDGDAASAPGAPCREPSGQLLVVPEG